MESRAKRAADILARAPLLGIPAAWYSRVVLEYDQLDVGPLRRSIGRVAKAGVPVINVMARAGWGMRVRERGIFAEGSEGTAVSCTARLWKAYWRTSSPTQ